MTTLLRNLYTHNNSPLSISDTKRTENQSVIQRFPLFGGHFMYSDPFGPTKAVCYREVLLVCY